jgi:hypothetical protein
MGHYIRFHEYSYRQALIHGLKACVILLFLEPKFSCRSTLEFLIIDTGIYAIFEVAYLSKVRVKGMQE